MNTLENRIESFNKHKRFEWPHKSINTKKFACAGLYYSPTAKCPDQVKCYQCGVTISGFDEKSVEPYDLHKTESPECPLMNLTINDARLETFQKGWPYKAKKSFKSTIQDFARAGFFYYPTIESKDQAICFYCGLRLDQWTNEDDPLLEHQVVNPDCAVFNPEKLKNLKGKVLECERVLRGNEEKEKDVEKAKKEELNEEPAYQKDKVIDQTDKVTPKELKGIKSNEEKEINANEIKAKEESSSNQPKKLSKKMQRDKRKVEDEEVESVTPSPEKKRRGRPKKEEPKIEKIEVSKVEEVKIEESEKDTNAELPKVEEPKKGKPGRPKRGTAKSKVKKDDPIQPDEPANVVPIKESENVSNNTESEPNKDIDKLEQVERIEQIESNAINTINTNGIENQTDTVEQVVGILDNVSTIIRQLTPMNEEQENIAPYQTYSNETLKIFERKLTIPQNYDPKITVETFLTQLMHDNMNLFKQQCQDLRQKIIKDVSDLRQKIEKIEIQE